MPVFKFLDTGLNQRIRSIEYTVHASLNSSHDRVTTFITE